MKKVLLCFLVAAAAAVPVEKKNEVGHHNYPRYIEFPGGDGNLHTVDLEDEIDTALLEKVTRDPTDTLYLLFTRQNPTTFQNLGIFDEFSIKNSNFNPEHPTVVIAHGWLSNQDTDLNPTIRDAFLGKGETNVIVVDWARLAISNYVTASVGVPAVGRGLGQFLNYLSAVTGAPLDSMHLVGFSLGAHLVGVAGRELGGKVARVTGCDPAGPLWYLSNDRISDADAMYVEVIHTDGGYAVEGLGIGTDVGHADFYPNGGASMPGCLSNFCNHNRSWKYFAATVTYNHLIARECSNILQINLDTCRGQLFPMGNDDLSKFGTGRYRVNTNRLYPY